jgi:hypothetical protein
MTVDFDLAAPAGVTVSPEGAAATALEPRGGGRVGARVTGYATRWRVALDDGRAGTFDAPPPFVFTAPRSDEGVPRDAALSVAWSPFGGATATLLAPDGPRAVTDNGGLVIPRGALPAGREVVLRLQRERSAPVLGTLTGALRVRLVTEMTLRPE